MLTGSFMFYLNLWSAQFQVLASIAFFFFPVMNKQMLNTSLSFDFFGILVINETTI